MHIIVCEAVDLCLSACYVARLVYILHVVRERLLQH